MSNPTECAKWRHRVTVGAQFDRLTVMSLARKIRYDSGGQINLWECKCTCGKTTIVSNRNLSSGHTRSCGCLKGKPIRHGFARQGKVHRFHMVWRNMLARCHTPQSTGYKHYGGRGIRVCTRWHTFENFRDDMFAGWQQGLTVERKDNDGPYSPDNCIWATRQQQANNKRTSRFLVINGVSHTYSEWQAISGIHQTQIRWRHKNGWPPELCVNPTDYRKHMRPNLTSGDTSCSPTSKAMSSK